MLSFLTCVNLCVSSPVLQIQVHHSISPLSCHSSSPGPHVLQLSQPSFVSTGVFQMPLLESQLCHSFLCPKSQLYPAESFLALSAGLLPRTDTNFFVLYYFFWKVRLITIKVVVEIEGKKKKNSEFKKPEPRVQKRLLIPLKSSSRPYY